MLSVASALRLSLFFDVLRSSAGCPYNEVIPVCRLQTGALVDIVVSEDCLLGSEGALSLRSRTLVIEAGARLVLHPAADVEVETGALRLDGELWVGCGAVPFQGIFQLRLTGSWEEPWAAQERDAAVDFSWRAASLPDLWDGAPIAFPKALLVTNTGRLELHGAPRVSWDYLSATASRGDAQLTMSKAVSLGLFVMMFQVSSLRCLRLCLGELLQGTSWIWHPRNWRPGDRIVVGSTSPDPRHSEMATVRRVEAGGRAVLLQSKLRAEHEGRFLGRGTRLNAPVGLLTRNIRVLGAQSRETPEAAWEACRESFFQVATDASAVRSACFGGHLLFIQNSTIHIEHVEFALLGQALQMARYPVHWHLAGMSYDDFIRNSSIHHSFQRCVTIHGSEGVHVQSNVCFRTFGHAFYLEDGIETGNVFERNLIMSVHQGGSVCTDWMFGDGPRTNLQLGPSGFWITNPNNSFSNNHVIGVGTGYWFTFPTDETCGLAAPSADLCRSSKHARAMATMAMGLSLQYFNDSRSGYGPDSWWLRQEQSRTPVQAFRRNAVGTAQRGIHVDGRVLSSADEHIPCWGDDCSTCSGPLEGSSSWVPMHFDVSLPRSQRSYAFQANVFEDFLAVHIHGPVESEARAVWASGGYILFKRAVFFNCHIVATGMPELTTACFKVTESSPPGFPLVFDGSLFISGDLSNSFFQLYDAGIHVKNSRWLMTPDTHKDFFVAKPKCAFGGNGNPLYIEGSRQLQNLTQNAGKFAWAARALGSDPSDSDSSRLASFQCIAWDSPYIKGSYVYSPDSFGLVTVPTILAPGRWQGSQQVHQLVGVAACESYLQETRPRFFCGQAFGTYGRWCGSHQPLEDCPGVVADPAYWYHSLLPWSNGDPSPEQAPVALPGAASPQSWPHDLPAGACAFPSQPPASTPFLWDPSCTSGGVGCNADGSHMECRWCGFEPYLPCPEIKANAKSPEGADVIAAVVALLLSASLLSLIMALCWYCASRRRPRSTRVSQLPRSEVPSLLGRTALPADKPRTAADQELPALLR